MSNHAKPEAPGEVWEDLIPPPGDLPFRPWWWHPSRYEGKHRGRYAYSLKALAIPFGVRSVLVRPYIDAAGTVLDEPVGLPGKFTAFAFAGDDIETYSGGIVGP